MKNGLFSRLKDKYSGLKSREKWLLKIALAVILFLLVDRGLIDPIMSYNEELSARTMEKTQLLSDIRKYVLHKEWQKDLFKGKASDFLELFMQEAKDGQLGSVNIKKTESSDKGISVSFNIDGDIQKILDFILKLEKLDFVALFQNVNIVLIKGSEYHFEGEIFVIKG
jgi:hypothetical protein